MAIVWVVVFCVFTVALALLCGVWRLCKKETPATERPAYSVAVSNRLFRDDDKEQLPCLNCRLIEMGEMACYQDVCPQCGNVPPGKTSFDEALEEEAQRHIALAHKRARQQQLQQQQLQQQHLQQQQLQQQHLQQQQLQQQQLQQQQLQLQHFQQRDSEV